MKVLLLNQAFYPDSVATAQQLTDLAIYLSEQGHEVSVLAGRRGYEQRDRVHAKFENYRGVQIHRVGSTGFGKRSFFTRLIDALTFDLALVWGLIRLPAQDLVVSYTSPPLIGFLGVLFTKLKGGRSAQWLMDVNPDAAIAVGYIRRASLVGRFLTWVLDFSLKQSQHVIVLDRWMRDKAIGHGATSEQIVIVPPWPAHRQEGGLGSGPTENAFRKEHGLSGKFVILYSGNHSIVHPLDSLLAAALKMRDDRNVVFLFIGGGLRVPDVTDFKKKHGLENIVQLPHQPRERLSESLSCADAHVVVMGNAVSGLVHTSKVYGILATGRPYLFIGPQQSHLGDLLAEVPGGFHAEEGDTEGVLTAIHAMQKLEVSQLEAIRKMNQGFLGNQGLDRSLSVFLTEVMQLPKPSGLQEARRTL